MSRFQWDRPRILLSEHPALDRICREYAGKLHDAGYDSLSELPYLFARLPNDTLIDARMRRMHREALLADEEPGEEESLLLRPAPPDPFDWTEPDALLRWMNEPVDQTGVSRYLLHLRRDRPLSQDAFPDLMGEDAQRYLRWINEEGRFGERLPIEVVQDPRSLDRPSHPAHPDTHPEGINLVGYLTAILGVGEASRQMALALKETGVPHSVTVHRDTASRLTHPFADDGIETARYSTNLLCVNPDRLESFRRTVSREFFDGRYTIGMWWWELARFPRTMQVGLDLVDEVWVGSDFIREAIAAETTKPVVRIPLPVSPPLADQRSRSELGLPDGFLFLFSFDFWSLFQRKNPLAAVEAFKRAFDPGSGASLILKSINGHRVLPALEELRYETADRDDIQVWDEYLDAPEKNALMGSCDCYVSLHRSEGFGLTMAEAMLHGKPVIATGYGGNLDFMHDRNSYLVPYELVSVGRDAGPYPEDSCRAEPDSMKRHALCATSSTILRTHVPWGKGQTWVREHHSPRRAAAAISKRLSEISAIRSAPVDDTSATVPGLW